MWRASIRIASPLLALGAVCLVIGTIPMEVWPAPRPGDSYVFNPPRFSGIWVQRTLVPPLTIGANVLFLIGLYALYRRDTASMPRWQRWSAMITLFGTAVWLLGTYMVVSAGSGASLGGILGVLLLGCAIILTFPGLVAWGTGYLCSGRVSLGVALAGAPLLTGVSLGASLSGIDFEPIGGLLFVAPTVAMAVVVSYDIWTDTPSIVSDQQANP